MIDLGTYNNRVHGLLCSLYVVALGKNHRRGRVNLMEFENPRRILNQMTEAADSLRQEAPNSTKIQGLFEENYKVKPTHPSKACAHGSSNNLNVQKLAYHAIKDTKDNNKTKLVDELLEQLIDKGFLSREQTQTIIKHIKADVAEGNTEPKIEDIYDNDIMDTKEYLDKLYENIK